MLRRIRSVDFTARVQSCTRSLGPFEMECVSPQLVLSTCAPSGEKAGF